VSDRSRRLGILVSGRGSNLNAVLEAVARGGLTGIEPRVVISNRAGVPALDVAARHGVPSIVLERSAFESAGARDARIGRALTDAGVDLAVLAGYDQLLRASYFEAFRGRTINIHPSLLPRHGGKGMMGLAVHRSVLAAGDPVTGVTIHEVTPELDAGPPLLQVEVPVLPGDDEERLAARVLAVEHRSLVEVLRREVLRLDPTAAAAAAAAAAANARASGAI
jgi:phosphoribosylglycinamide formyltransferase-1